MATLDSGTVGKAVAKLRHHRFRLFAEPIYRAV